MTCPECKAPNRPGASRCKQCTSALPPSCFGCGKAVTPEEELCHDCRTERVPQAMGVDEPDRTVPDLRRMPGEYDLNARFIGRKAIQERLRRLLIGCRDSRELHLVSLIGGPGVGKTRLARELARMARATIPDLEVLYTICGGPATAPYSAFQRLFSGRFGIVEGDSARAARDKILAGCVETVGEGQGTEVAHLIGELVRHPFDGSPVVAPLIDSPAQLEMRMFIAVRRFFAADARRAPLLLIFDELERCAPETVNLVHYLAAGLRGQPIVILCAARPSLTEQHPTFGEGDFAVERIELAPLTPDESQSLLLALLREAGTPPPELVAHVRERLDGSPRAIVDLVRLLLEASIIRPASGGDAGATAAAGGDRATPAEAAANAQAPGRAPSFTLDGRAFRSFAFKMPASHEDILAERLRIMAAGDRDLLEKAAACGEAFWLDALVALVRAVALERGNPDGPTLGEIAAAGDRSRVAAAETLSRLERRGFLYEAPQAQIPGEREWRFAYQPLQELIYDGIAEGPRRRYHQLVAQWLELRPEGRNEEEQEEVGRHLERAGDGEGAAARYRRAADAARARYYNDKAIRLYAQALECLGREDLASRIHLWHDLGSVYALRGEFDAALGAFERMLRLAWVVASRVKGAVAFNKMGRIWRQKGDLNLALEYLERGLELFQQAEDARGVAGSLDDIGHALWMLGRYEEALDRSAAALEERRRLGDRRSIASSLSNIGNIEKDRGLFDEAESCHREALELRRETGDRVGECESRKNLGIIAAERGDFEAARREWEQALRIAREIGSLPMQSMLLNNLGEVAVAQQNLAEARRTLEEALGLAREIDDKRVLVDALRNLGLCELRAGQFERARVMCEEALELARKAKLRDFEGRALVALGEVFATTLFDDTGRGQRNGSAEQFFSRGIEIYREIGNEAELARGLERLGKYRIERGDLPTGRQLLEEAAVIFERLGMQAGDRVRRVVEELG
jgi:tetratricopeptide (TPR) repeat protein